MRQNWIGNKEPETMGTEEETGAIVVHNEQKNERQGKSFGEILTTVSVALSLVCGAVGVIVSQNQRISTLEFTEAARSALPADVKALQERAKVVDFQLSQQVDENKKLHEQLDHDSETLSSINAHVAGIDAKLDELLARPRK